MSMQQRRTLLRTLTALLLSACAVASGAAQAAGTTAPDATRPKSGINLASGGFANDRLPGRYGFDYVYPDADVAGPFVEAGMKIVRLPILWERIQPKRGEPLDAGEMERVDTMIQSMKGFETVILDVHNFGTYFGKRLDGEPALKLAFGNLWSRLGARYRSNPRIAFGLMNEPNGMSARSARELADIAISAIRNAGARNLVLVPGTQWTAAHSWTEGADESNAVAFGNFKDPADHFVFELHDYLDANASGTKPECPNANIGVERLTAATAWLRKQNRKALLGEFGVSTLPVCLAGMQRMLAFMDANADVWYGWTYWAGGAWWGDYFMSVQPKEGEVKPQMRVLMDHMKRAK